MDHQTDWPEWWHWELDCANPHLTKRMADRSFSEAELRTMLEYAARLRSDALSGRWIIQTSHAGRPWEVIVEPDPLAQILVVVTAYPVAAS